MTHSLEIRTLRQSLVNTWDICPLRAWYSQQDLPYVTSEAAAKGTAFHRAMEVYYGRWMDDPEPGPHRHRASTDIDLYEYEAVETFREEVERAEDRMRWDTNFDTAALAVSDTVLGYFTRGYYWPEDHQVLAVEHTFDVPFPVIDRTYRMQGTIDLVLRSPDGRIVLVDHKTASRKWPNRKNNAIVLPQAAIYSWAWKQVSGHPAHFFVFDVVLNNGDLDRRWMHAETIQAEATIHRVGQIAMTMDALDAAGTGWPANPSSNLCTRKYCDHWDICPHGSQSRPE